MCCTTYCVSLHIIYTFMCCTLSTCTVAIYVIKHSYHVLLPHTACTVATCATIHSLALLLIVPNKAEEIWPHFKEVGQTPAGRLLQPPLAAEGGEGGIDVAEPAVETESVPWQCQSLEGAEVACMCERGVNSLRSTSARRLSKRSRTTRQVF